MVSSARFGTAEYGGALYGVNPAWRVDGGVRWDLIAQTVPRGSSHLESRYDGGEPLTDLPGAQGIRATFRLREPSSVEWRLPHSDPATALVRELSTDVVVWRNGLRLERCRVGPTSDDVDEDTGTAAYAAHDYRAILERRLIPSGLLGNSRWTNTDQALIAWRLLEFAQLGATWGQILGFPDGRWLALARGHGQTTGRLRTREYSTGKPVGEAIRQLSEVIDGFDWSISPTGSFDIHYPRRGVGRSFVAHLGATVQRLRRTVDTSQYATMVRQSGADDVPARYAYTPDVDERPEGAWHAQLGDPDIIEAETLAEKAEGELEARQLLPGYTLTLTPGVWDGPETCWLGDTIRLVARSGYRLDVDTEVRIVEIAVDVGDDGGETVRLVCDRPPPDLFRSTYYDRSRLTNLERR